MSGRLWEPLRSVGIFGERFGLSLSFWEPLEAWRMYNGVPWSFNRIHERIFKNENLKMKKSLQVQKWKIQTYKIKNKHMKQYQKWIIENNLSCFWNLKNSCQTFILLFLHFSFLKNRSLIRLNDHGTPLYILHASRGSQKLKDNPNRSPKIPTLLRGSQRLPDIP